MPHLLSSLVLLLAIAALVRRIEVRLVLLLAGAVLTALAGQPLAAADALASAMVATFVPAICASVGFAAVLAHTGCDRDLARVLLRPVARCPSLALPGVVMAGFVANVAIPSQTGTAATLAPIALPMLHAAGIAPSAAAAALLLGVSFGGDLLSPAAQDVLAIGGLIPIDHGRVHRLLAVAVPSGLAVAALAGLVTWRRLPTPAKPQRPDVADITTATMLRAAVPLLPTTMLLLAHAGMPSMQWLTTLPDTAIDASWGPSLAVVRAMLIGSVLAFVVGDRAGGPPTKPFFEGMGQAYANVVSLTMCAQVFGTGIAASGLADSLLAATESRSPGSLVAFGFPMLLAMMSGSGSGSVLACAQAMLGDAAAGPELDRCAAMACVGGALGRTASPAAAVVVCVAGFAKVSPLAALSMLAIPLALGGLVTFLIVMLS